MCIHIHVASRGLSGYLPQSLSMFSFETGSIAEPEVHPLSFTNQAMSLQGSTCLSCSPGAGFADSHYSIWLSPRSWGSYTEFLMGREALGLTRVQTVTVPSIYFHTPSLDCTKPCRKCPTVRSIPSEGLLKSLEVNSDVGALDLGWEN